jgi:hypothetical protein
MGYDFFNTKNGVREIDLRKEFEGFLDGDRWDLPKKQLIIFRKMRRQEGIYYPLKESDLQASPAIRQSTSSTDHVYPNAWSESEKFLFDDYFVYGYKRDLRGYDEKEMPQPFSQLITGLYFYYFEAHVMPSRFDRIIEPVIDPDGNIVSPIRPAMVYDIQDAYPFRSDATENDYNSRIEFWRCLVNRTATPEVERDPVDLNDI